MILTLCGCVLTTAPPLLRPYPYPVCSYVFHYIVERGLIFLCLADEKQKRRIPFLYLDDIKQR